MSCCDGTLVTVQRLKFYKSDLHAVLCMRVYSPKKGVYLKNAKNRYLAYPPVAKKVGLHGGSTIKSIVDNDICKFLNNRDFYADSDVVFSNNWYLLRVKNPLYLKGVIFFIFFLLPPLRCYFTFFFCFFFFVSPLLETISSPLDTLVNILNRMFRFTYSNLKLIFGTKDFL